MKRPARSWPEAISSISETAISQGSLVVKIKEQQLVSQPIAPFTENATTAVVPDTTISGREEKGHLIRVPKVVTVSDSGGCPQCDRRDAARLDRDIQCAAGGRGAARRTEDDVTEPNRWIWKTHPYRSNR